MKIKNANFVKSCTKVADLPNYPYPEFAFFGRSNVGKSSLINMLMGRKKLVRTGSKPGVTRTINIFVANEKISIVDLPGYGYSKVPHELKKKFLPMIKNYINKRENLKLAFLLIDIRRVPDDFENDIISLLINNRIPVAVTLTKCDKISKNIRSQYAGRIRETLGIDDDSTFYTSGKTGEGKKELLNIIGEYGN